jgi:pimeloyl-ACP methyl ester carboxylesterase/class 3 adenylate cyclase
MVLPMTRYAKSSDVHIAYQVFGVGPIDLVFVPGFVSHIEHYWDHPDLARWLLRLGSFARVIMFDKRGTGLSDPVSEVPSLEQRMDDVRAVMDVAGIESAAALGVSEGGALAALFAAAYPERCKALALYGAFARSPLSPETLKAFAKYADSAWGSGLSLPWFAPSRKSDSALQQWWGRFERLGGSPAAAMAVVRMAAEFDISDILPSIHVPTLVIHCTGDTLVDVECGRFFARSIPGARLIELPGQDHLFFIHERIGDAIEDFLTGSVSAVGQRPGPRDGLVYRHCRLDRARRADWRPALARSARRSSRRRAAGARSLPRQRGQIARRRISRYVRRSGARGALRLRDCGGRASARHHAGEIEIAGNDVRGIAVHIASRVSARAKAGEILVSRTVKDLVAGSGLHFDERGKHSLKGLTEPMELYAAAL